MQESLVWWIPVGLKIVQIKAIKRLAVIIP
jgi:hypothetical protein